MNARRSMPWNSTALLLVAVTFLFACSSDSGGGNGVTPPPSAQPGTVSGSVVDAGGQGVPGATVTLEQGGTTSQTATSSGTGSFQFAQVAAGTWQVRVSPPAGFTVAAGQANPVTVTVASSQTATVTLTLQQDLPATTGEVAGHVRLGGTGIQGVVVELRNASGTVGTETTPADGKYTFRDVEAGEYTVTVTLPAAFQLAGGEQATKPASVTAGQSTDVDYEVVLAQASPVVQITLATGPNRFVGPGGGSTETVARGTTVRWVNASSVFHTVTPQNHNAWDRAETNAPGTVLEVLLLNPGTFDYFCEPHLGEGMTGSVVVQ